MEHQRKDLDSLPEEPAETPEETPVEPQNAMQRFYEHFRGVPLKYIDAFIAVCTGALVLLLIWGTLKGRGVI